MVEGGSGRLMRRAGSGAAVMESDAGGGAEGWARLRRESVMISGAGASAEGWPGGGRGQSASGYGVTGLHTVPRSGRWRAKRLVL